MLVLAKWKGLWAKKRSRTYRRGLKSAAVDIVKSPDGFQDKATKGLGPLHYMPALSHEED